MAACTGSSQCGDAQRVAAIFFPQAKALGCEVDAGCSPALQRKIVAAATRGRSYEEASESLGDLADVQVSTKQCQRVAQRIGRERVAQRDERRKQFEQLPLPQQCAPPADAPANDWSGRVAAVLMDGGRAQLRDERWGTPQQPGEKKRRWWREPKAACVATFLGRPHDSDPLPEIPACLLDPLWVVPRIQEIKRTRGGEPGDGETPVETAAPGNASASGTDEPRRDESDVASGVEAADPQPTPESRAEHWSPPPLVKSVVATFGSYERLGELTRVEAWQRGFDAASRKVFLGDGHLSNWATRDRQFSAYTAVTDLLHALSYVYTAAVESSPDMEAAWHRYSDWASATWQGRVQDVLAELRPLAAAATDADAAKRLASCVTYLHNNADRMRYDLYRQQGMPITTTLIESTIKQINRRMKGTEKFWDEGGEPQLQLCAYRLSDTRPLQAFWQQRASSQTGFCNRCAKT